MINIIGNLPGILQKFNTSSMELMIQQRFYKSTIPYSGNGISAIGNLAGFYKRSIPPVWN